jgi:BlaI family transcriptional regulator, penicillinase repressor
MKKMNHKDEEIMAILWRRGHAFVNDILADMEEPKPPYNTVSSAVRKLVDWGYVGFEAFGKTHRYFPILKKEEYRVNAFRRLVDNYFGGSPKALLSFFVKEENIDPAEIDHLLNEIKKVTSDE